MPDSGYQISKIIITVFPHIRPAGIIFLYGLQMRVLLERGYYSRAWIILKDSKLKKNKARIFTLMCIVLMTSGTLNCGFLMMTIFFLSI